VLSKALGGQAVVVENLPGAGGITRTAAMLKTEQERNATPGGQGRHQTVLKPGERRSVSLNPF
jgi:tripartite-type tricarboxylate transporter receptor subunit TctC